MEAYTVTGVVKALLAYYGLARQNCWADISIATFVRPAPGGAEPPPNAFIKTMRELGFPVEVILERGPFDRRAHRALADLIRREKPDIVETHAIKSHVLMRVNRPSSRWVAFHHGYTAQDFKMRLYNRLNPWALRGADAVVTVCDVFREALAREGVPKERVSVVPNAIAPFSSRPALRERGSAGLFTFVAIGRLSAEKGHSYLIDAAAELQRALADGQQPSGPNLFRVLLVGDGPERPRLNAQVAALGLTNIVEFLGHQSDPLSFYEAANAFVLPSLTEGSPLALLEAMMARVPVIASAVGGVPETVADEITALLVPSQNPRALASAMQRLMSDEELSHGLSAAAHDVVTTRHTPEAYARALLSLYRSLPPHSPAT